MRRRRLLPPVVSAGIRRLVIVEQVGLVLRLLAASGRAQRIQLGGELAAVAALDKRVAVIPHGLVAGIRVAGHDGIDRRHEHEDQKDQRENGIVDKEDDAHDTRHDARLVKDAGEEEEQNRVDKRDHGDGDVVDVALLVHPRSKNAHRNEHQSIQNEECDHLHHRRLLTESHKHALDEDVGQRRKEEVVRRCFVLHVQEPPLVETGRVGVENVRRVPVHGHGPLGQENNLERGPSERDENRQEDDHGQDHFGRGIMLRKLPQAEDGHLREPDQRNAEHDAADHNLPPVPKVTELVPPQVAGFRQNLANDLEPSDDDEHGARKDDVEHDAREEDVGPFDARSEPDPLNAAQDDRAHLRSLRSPGDGVADQFGCRIQRPFPPTQQLHRRCGEVGKQRRRRAPGRPLVPSRDGLKKTEPDDTHAPLEILGPRFHDRRHPHRGHAEDRLALEVTEHGEHRGCHVGGRVGMP